MKCLKQGFHDVEAVGSDRNIPDSILEYRANLLSSLIELYHGDFNTLYNVVLATQLPISLTKLLVYSDPYRTKIAESITVAFHVPNGVSLISAHIPKRDYTQLVDASRNIPIYFNNCTTTVPSNGPAPFAIKKKIIPSKELGGTVGGYQMLKSDKSIIFSHIPEEESVGSDGVAEQIPKKPFSVSRPTFLPLKFKNLTSRDIIDSGVNSINFDESDSFPNFIGKTSVCSTPLTENKIVPNRNMMSICVTQDVAPTQEGENSDSTAPGEESSKAKGTAGSDGSFKHLNVVKYAILNNPFMASKKVRAVSMTNLDQKHCDEADANSTPDEINLETSKTSRKAQLHKLLCKDYNALKTISDPLYHLIDQRKRAMSFSLFQDFQRLRNEHFAEMVGQEQEEKEKGSKDKEKNLTESKQQPPTATNGVGGVIRKTESFLPELSGAAKSATTPKDRRALNLPIKSFNLNDDQHTQRVGNSSASGGQELFTRRKSTLELTPLMTKLTVLAMNDPESSGVSSWDTTPGCSYNMAMSPQEYIPQRRKSQDISQSAGAPLNGANGDDEKALVKVELFVCVQQNMTLVLVMQERNSKNQRLVQALFESCVSKFLRIENDIQLAMNINVDGYDKADGYSLVALDANWDVAKKSGPWSTLELQTTESLHTYFRKSNLVTEVTLKSQESVLYGYQCGMRELFYSQMANAQGGLPPPQDVMGSIIKQALTTFSPGEIFLSFNGGKDCTVLLDLIHSSNLTGAREIKCIYVRPLNPFSEIEEFVEQCREHYGITISTVNGGIKSALEAICREDTQIKACIMGSRRSDPYCEQLEPFKETDAGWPKLMRINPLLDWTCDDIWNYIREQNVPYCTLYERG
uniref:Phosphoadenosine phosphosulphate reductase domain-containing protein n=1 Tax=Anopheles atroparvus TaxID=41427 RepID=A0A182JB84_ANOAO